MAKSSMTRGLDRRAFFRGRWVAPARDPVTGQCEIASILVQARPDRLDAVIGAIEAMPRAKIYSRNARGKFVVVLESPDVGGLGAGLNAISSMPGVLSATLVFQGTDGA